MIKVIIGGIVLFIVLIISCSIAREVGYADGFQDGIKSSIDIIDHSFKKVMKKEGDDNEVV